MVGRDVQCVLDLKNSCMSPRMGPITYILISYRYVWQLAVTGILAVNVVKAAKEWKIDFKQHFLSSLEHIECRDTALDASGTQGDALHLEVALQLKTCNINVQLAVYIREHDFPTGYAKGKQV